MVMQYRRKWLMTAVLAVFLLFGANVPAAGSKSLSNGFTGTESQIRSGMWWNPNRPGHGMDLHLAGDTLFLVWYTYDAGGFPTWYLAAAAWQGESWTATLNSYTWDVQAKSAQPNQAGSVTLDFQDTTHATFSWTLGGDEGTEPFELFQVAGAIAPDDHTGHWWAPLQPGYGLTLNDQGSFEFAILYFYDQSGVGRWALGDNAGETANTLQLLGYFSACPSCEDLAITTQVVGEVTVTFFSETRGRLTTQISLLPPLQGEWTIDAVIAMASDAPSGRAHSAALAQFASAEALELFLKEGLQQSVSTYGGPEALDFSPGAPEGGFSTTNLQEAGVDEADTIKSDGSVLYAAVNDLFDIKGAVHTAPNRIRVLGLKQAPYGVTPITDIVFGDALERPLEGMYLISDRKGEGAPDLLAAVTGSNFYYFEPLDFWPSPWPWVGGATDLYLFDVSNPENPVQAHHLSLDGHLLASRRIGESLYLVTRYTPEVEGLIFFPSTSEEEASNAALLEQFTLAELLPDFRVNGEYLGELVDPDAAFLPPIPGGYFGADLITLSRIDLGDPSVAPASVSIIGQSETVYASTQAFYLATTRYDYGVEFGNIVYPEFISTDIHKFGLVQGAPENRKSAPGAPEYRGSASVQGHLGWDEDNKPFRMGEHDGVLRVVTSADFMWGASGQNRLTLLEESGGPLLKELSHLPNAQRPETLGKPDERLYGTRFVGNRLFAVTFLFVDPLIIVDLSDSSDPFINGQLVIPGFSDYLHPISEDWLLGVGKDAVVVQNEIGDGRFAWFQGVKIGLFNVSNPALPSELDSVTIGRRGSESEVLFDHHAFTYVPAIPDKAKPTRFAIPVSVHDALNPGGVSPDPTTYYPWHHTGLYLFEISDAGELLSRGAVIAASYPQSEWDPYDPYTGGNRALIVGDGIHYIPKGDVFSAPWAVPENVIGPQ